MGYKFVWFAVISFFLLKENAIATDKVPYIVYPGEPPRLLAGSNQALHYARVAKSHCKLLGSILGSPKAAKNAIFYSYTQHINGFAATIDEETANKISSLESDGNVNSNSLWSKAGYGKDTIIGNLDTGVWPESKSFANDGMTDVPTAVNCYIE
ncbi:subtilisin-like protease SBT5.4 [Carex rostrata]